MAKKMKRKSHMRRAKFGEGAHSKVTAYSVHSLDVWGNRKDGYDVNDIFPSQGLVNIPDGADTKTVVKHLRRAGFINKPVRLKSFDIDGGYDGSDITIDYKGRPELILREK
jgi:hypothetical protein